MVIIKFGTFYLFSTLDHRCTRISNAWHGAQCTYIINCINITVKTKVYPSGVLFLSSYCNTPFIHCMLTIALSENVNKTHTLVPIILPFTYISNMHIVWD